MSVPPGLLCLSRSSLAMRHWSQVRWSRAISRMKACSSADDNGLRRVVEVVLDLFEFGNLGAFSDVERAIVEGETVRPVQAGGDDFCLTFAVLVDNRIDLVENG